MTDLGKNVNFEDQVEFFKNVLEYRNCSKFVKKPNFTYTFMWEKKFEGQKDQKFELPDLNFEVLKIAWVGAYIV